MRKFYFTAISICIYQLGITQIPNLPTISRPQTSGLGNYSSNNFGSSVSYLVGKFPFQNTKNEGDDLANRLVAKFKLDNSKGDFWDKHFLPMPNDVLFPPDDALHIKLKEHLSNFEKGYNKNKI